jgi:hypothetical protein
MKINVSNKAITIDTIRLILFLTKKLTTGLSKTAMMTAKTSGTIMLWAIYKMASNPIKPMIKMVALA